MLDQTNNRNILITMGVILAVGAIFVVANVDSNPVIKEEQKDSKVTKKDEKKDPKASKKGKKNNKI